MAGFMNAELIAIRDKLTCGHCGAVFQGTDHQARGVKYEKRTVYCSDFCRISAVRNRLSKPVPNRGPCKQCGKEFFSRNTKKQFCSMGCYTKSPQFLEMLKRNSAPTPERIEKAAAKLRKGEMIPCRECGKDVWRKPSDKTNRFFCCKQCYRSYMAKRFDRWVANPQGIALPQCYDEFLDKEILPCVIEGCGWKGKHLSVHMNMTHGVQATDFKRAAGFNLSTGVVSKDLSKKMSDRAIVGVAADHRRPPVTDKSTGPGIRYISLEGREHLKKGRALAATGTAPPQRACKGCGITFRQTTPFGKTLYCSPKCRDENYARIRRACK